MNKSWRSQNPYWPEEDEPDKKLAFAGFVSIIFLGCFYALTVASFLWMIDVGLEWRQIFVFGLVAGFTRALDKFLTK